MRALLSDLCYQVIDAADVAGRAFIDHLMSFNGMAKEICFFLFDFIYFYDQHSLSTFLIMYLGFLNIPPNLFDLYIFKKNIVIK